MQNLQISFVLSIWPMHWTAGHDFDGEQHKWWAAVGPVGITIHFEPLPRSRPLDNR